VAAVLDKGTVVFVRERVQEGRRQMAGLIQHSMTVGGLAPASARCKYKRAARWSFSDVITRSTSLILAQTFAGWRRQLGALPYMFVQVNTGRRGTEGAGIFSTGQTADAFNQGIVSRLDLPVRGLMCIPAGRREPRLHFAFAGKIAARTGVGDLFDGVSSDFEKAIRLVRPMCASALPSLGNAARLGCC